MSTAQLSEPTPKDRKHAEALDAEDPQRHLRNEFIIPTKADLKRKTLAKSTSTGEEDDVPCIYLCGNSLGLQPRRLLERVESHLATWATKGVLGHFKNHEDSTFAAWLHVDEAAAKSMAPVVGALPTEVAIMETLSANLHLMMASFYHPIGKKKKIMLEAKAFPSDRYAVESHIRHNDVDPEDAMILLEPADPQSAIIPTSQIVSMIEENAESLALILLPGIQYYTGQYFDIQTITAHAHAFDIPIGWDLAHAVGNMELRLHDWDVDFAVWCNYKYMNAGPGAIAALFVHEKHGNVKSPTPGEGYRPRLCGWWGGDKNARFGMGSKFLPIPGAAGFQLGNPCALAITAVTASLEIFEQTSMTALRTKSIILTGYLQELLLSSCHSQENDQNTDSLFNIITPLNPAERGNQLSIRLKPGLLEGVLKALEAASVVVDERKPDVIRVAPTPLYNTYAEVWDFVQIFLAACQKTHEGQLGNGVDVPTMREKE